MIDINATLVRGENFLKIADHVLMYYDVHYYRGNLKDGDIVYCDTSSLYRFRDLLMARKDLTIITHNCIGSVTDEPAVTFRGVTGASTKDFEGCYSKWFAKNCYSSKENVMPIPLGFGNVRWDTDGMNKATFNMMPNIVPSKDIYLNCKIDTNPEKRQECWDQCSKMNNATLSGPNLRFDKFMTTMADYKFIASPDGAGVDCHRTWEALFLNRIPIIKNKYPLKRLYDNMPVLFVNEWSDLVDMDLDKIYKKMSGTMDKKYLTQEYWNNIIINSGEYYE